MNALALPNKGSSLVELPWQRVLEYIDAQKSAWIDLPEDELQTLAKNLRSDAFRNAADCGALAAVFAARKLLLNTDVFGEYVELFRKIGNGSLHPLVLQNYGGLNNSRIFRYLEMMSIEDQALYAGGEPLKIAVLDRDGKVDLKDHVFKPVDQLTAREWRQVVVTYLPRRGHIRTLDEQRMWLAEELRRRRKETKLSAGVFVEFDKDDFCARIRIGKRFFRVPGQDILTAAGVFRSWLRNRSI